MRAQPGAVLNARLYEPTRSAEAAPYQCLPQVIQRPCLGSLSLGPTRTTRWPAAHLHIPKCCGFGPASGRRSTPFRAGVGKIDTVSNPQLGAVPGEGFAQKSAKSGHRLGRRKAICSGACIVQSERVHVILRRGVAGELRAKRVACPSARLTPSCTESPTRARARNGSRQMKSSSSHWASSVRASGGLAKRRAEIGGGGG